jgi:hypothetical protein
MSEFIAMYKDNAREIAEIMNVEFMKEPADKKLLHFFTVHEVIFKTKDSTIELIAAFGDLLLSWVQAFAVQVEDFNHMD